MTSEDQDSINTFGRLNNRYHDIQSQIKAKKVRSIPHCLLHACLGVRPVMHSLVDSFTRSLTHSFVPFLSWPLMGIAYCLPCSTWQKFCEDLEDASNELMLSDDDVVKYSYGFVFVHMSNDDADQKLQDGTSTRKKRSEPPWDGLGLGSQTYFLRLLKPDLMVCCPCHCQS